jgi:hypothetical protein
MGGTPSADKNPGDRILADKNPADGLLSSLR